MLRWLRLRLQKRKLMQSAQSLFTKMYENMQQNQGGQAGPGSGMPERVPAARQAAA